MSSLKESLVKLGSTNPELRQHIRPLLAKIAMEFPTEIDLNDYLDEHPNADPKNHWVKKRPKPERNQDRDSPPRDRAYNPEEQWMYDD